MKYHKVIFDSIEWTDSGISCRYKAFIHSNQRLRFVEFSEGFVEPDWCTHGHAGIVLDGSFILDFNGNAEWYEKGDVIFISAGEADKHKVILGKDGKVALILFEILEGSQ